MMVEKELEKIFWSFGKDLSPRPELFLNTKNQLKMMKKHHLPTYLHEIRVGLIAAYLAEAMGERDIKPEFFGGANHDMGKLLVEKKILETKDITNEEYEEIKSHAEVGYYLQEKFLFTSFIAGFHHNFQENGYGVSEKALESHKIEENQKKRIITAARRVALADFFDALLTRKTKLKNGNGAEPEEIMASVYPDSKEELRILFGHEKINEIINPFFSKLFQSE